jgi:hypothetical protein
MSNEEIIDTLWAGLQTLTWICFGCLGGFGGFGVLHS